MEGMTVAVKMKKGKILGAVEELYEGMSVGITLAFTDSRYEGSKDT